MGIFMGARKIVERVVVDGITGEVLDSQISFVKWQSGKRESGFIPTNIFSSIF